jgi:hypothetical protein
MTPRFAFARLTIGDIALFGGCADHHDRAGLSRGWIETRQAFTEPASLIWSRSYRKLDTRVRNTRWGCYVYPSMTAEVIGTCFGSTMHGCAQERRAV